MKELCSLGWRGSRAIDLPCSHWSPLSIFLILFNISPLEVPFKADLCHYKLRCLPTNFIFSFIILLRCSLFFLILFLLFFSKNNKLNKWEETNLKMWTLFDNNFLYFIISFYIYNFIIYLSILIDEFFNTIPNIFQIEILFKIFYRFKI